MAVRLNVNANVTGARQVTNLNRAIGALGRGSAATATRLGTLEAASARGRASFAALGTALRVGVVAGFAAAAFAVQRFVRSTIDAGNLIESSRVQFNAFFGDAEVGGQAFDTLNEFAGRVPFTLEEIIRGGTALAAISDGPLELGRNLEIVGNLAASANLDFATAALQYQRVASAGVAAADLLRDRGVTGLLGFVSGATYTAEESVRVFEEAFGEGGRFGGVTANLAETLQGQTSLVQDALFRFRAAAAVPLFEGLSRQIRNLIGDFENNDQALRELAETIGTNLASAFQSIENIIRTLHDNIGLISAAFRALIVIQVARYIQGLVAAVTTLNVVLAVNPIGAVVIALTAGITAIIAFRSEINGLIADLGELVLGDESLQAQVRAAEDTLAAEEARLQAARELVEQREREIALTTQQAAAQRNFQALANGEIVTVARKNQLEVAALGNYRNKVNFQRLINEGVAKEAETAATINRALAEGANQRRLSFQEIVRAAELEEVNRLVMEQEQEWRDIQQVIDDGASTAVNSFFDDIQAGESVFDSLKNVALNALNDIARAAASNALSDILSGGSRSGSGAVGGIGGIIAAGRSFLGFQDGGIVPGGAPYTDRVPALLTPGERVIPRDQVNNNSSNTSNITNINISGNVDQRSIDQIRGVIATSSAEVGGANRQYTQNTNGLKSRNN